MMPYCRQCGQKLYDNASHCHKCGHIIEQPLQTPPDKNKTEPKIKGNTTITLIKAIMIFFAVFMVFVLFGTLIGELSDESRNQMLNGMDAVSDFSVRIGIFLGSPIGIIILIIIIFHNKSKKK